MKERKSDIAIEKQKPIEYKTMCNETHLLNVGDYINSMWNDTVCIY